MKNEKKQSPVKKFSLDDFKTQAKAISSTELLETITGGLEDDCHVKLLQPSGNGGGGASEGKL
jgi:hypothetical protein